MVGSVVDQAVFTKLVAIHLPQLAGHLDKLQLDTSTFSVPWFLCLFLNSVSLPTAVTLLDTFFLNGPKSLFWIALSVLKLNESSLLSRGKDDDIFVAILKDYFQRLSLGDCDEEVKTGRPLYNQLINSVLAYSTIITTEVVEVARNECRLQVVHSMESVNRKTQVRRLVDFGGLAFDEVALVYDRIRSLQYFTNTFDEDNCRRSNLVDKGGWGLVKKLKCPLEGQGISHKHFRAVYTSLTKLASNTNTFDLIERTYYFLSFQSNYIHRLKPSSTGSNLNTREDEFIVDLAALIHSLDFHLKQPLHTRLRFLFDLFDLNGDGFLSDDDLKQVMDTFLDIFSSPTTKGGIVEEGYLRAVSGFMTAALGMGKSEGVGYRLAFNEFLLAVLSQSCFVQYFETVWVIGGI